MIDLSAFKPKTYYTPPAASDNPLRRRRGELRLSAEEAAGRLGISLETLRTWEYRKAVPAPCQVEAVARAYELPVEKAVLMRCELALGRKPAGMLSPGIHAYTLANWTCGETYRALGARCGVRAMTLSRWVNGQNVPESRHIPRLAEVLGRSEADVAVACYRAWERAHRSRKGAKKHDDG